MRKHLYLITEHENDDRIGCCKIFDSPMSHPVKNEEGPITVLDEESEGFKKIGRMVGLGYHDFEDESEYRDTDRFSDVLHDKLGEIDDEHLEAAGLNPTEFA